ncbi:MAG: glycoside hydrolase family 9 protein [Kiritimatiellia bacterium]
MAIRTDYCNMKDCKNGKMFLLVSWVLAALWARAGTAVPGVWRATALDPSTVVLQGNYAEREQAAFSMTDEERLLTGWKYDAAFRSAGERSLAHRAGTEAKLKAGPYTAEGASIEAFAWWKYPIGAKRYPGKDGYPKSFQGADVMEILYLKLAAPMVAGARVTFSLPTGEKVAFVYEPENTPTPLIKVNQVGYAPSQGKKFAYLGMWLGPAFGAYEPKEGLVFELVDAVGGSVVKQGPVVFRVSDCMRGGTTFSGEKTYEMDFSDFTKPGRYYVRIPGVGRSWEFPIDESAIGEAFAVHMKGLYHQRCGCAKTKDLTYWTDKACHTEVLRGVHPSNEWEYNECFTDADGRKIQTKHFAVLTASMRDFTERLSLPGGWHDAADYDRRPMHLDIVNSLAALYLLRPDSFTDGQLAIPERGNGIPDILDEAEWGLRHLRAGQQEDGGVGTWIEASSHPSPSDGCTASGDKLVYSLAKATHASSLAYASHAALLARALLKVGTPKAQELARVYKTSAIAAFSFSQRPAGAPVKMRSGWSREKEIEVTYHEPEALDANEVVKACINLYMLTQKREYLDAMAGVSEAYEKNTVQSGWRMSAERHAEFLFTEIADPHYKAVRDFWHKRILGEADEMLAQAEGATSYAYRIPWYGHDDWRASHMSWGNCHPLRRAKTLCYAHALTGERKYLNAAYLANDFHNGCNPNGSTWTSGLGKVYPVSYLSIVSVNDGIDEYVPGITPYRCTCGIPPMARQHVWGEDKASMSWPYFRQYPNLEEFTVANSEFTVWETIAPAAFTTGYLLQSGAKVPFIRREPARSRRDLPGYWAMP